MNFHDLRYQKKDHVATITVSSPGTDRPARVRLAADLGDLCAEIAWDEEVRVVVVTGAEKQTFSLDIPVTAIGQECDEEGDCAPVSLAGPLAQLDKPVIITVDGDAMGPGLEFVMACDIRFASETSRFGLPQVHRGLIPSDGGTQRLSRLVGLGKALEMILTGDIIDAREAERIGLINRVASSDTLMAAAMQMAVEMATKAPVALRFAKEAVHKGTDLTLEQGLTMEGDLYLLLYSTADRTEGIKAFQGKRTPTFEGK